MNKKQLRRKWKRKQIFGKKDEQKKIWQHKHNTRFMEKPKLCTCCKIRHKSKFHHFLCDACWKLEQEKYKKEFNIIQV